MTVIDRFLTYVTFDTTSDETSDTCPSTAKQLILADYLVKELKDIGITDAMRDENGYVYGHVPASAGMENEPKIGLIAHMDTSPDVSGKDVKPQIITFDGTNAPMVDKRYVGEQLIVTDQTTLLGADDKAGVAEIIAACDVLMKDAAIKHGQISICFTPDEEIGRGADRFDFERFDAVYAYTVDGGELGGIECENFNAASVKLIVHGINTHPGSAKNKMRNAILFLHEFIALLPPAETPAHTEGYEGFYHINAVEGDETTASLHMLIRDHSDAMFEKRKAFVADTVRYLGGKYGEKDSDNHTGKKEWTTTKTTHEQKWSCCGKVVVAKESHTFGKWVITKKATSRKDGEKTRTCEVCEYVEKATIQATGSPAKTGDDSHIGMWAGILCVSLAGIIVLVVLYRKKHKK